MTTSEPANDGDAMLRAAGIEVTEEGKARARRRRREFEARWTPEKWAMLRRRLGLPEAKA
jgi:hypothetical protein